jgi:predicted O-methyltransferase YrrM
MNSPGMSRIQTPITDQLCDYLSTVTLREPEALRHLREATEDHPKASLQIGPEQGQFLNLLARTTGARRAIEVGVFMGYSSTWIALALPPGGKVIACDVSEEFAARARQTWREAGVEDRVEPRLGPALDTLDGLLAAGYAGSFDFAFIDADKQNYANYYERCLELLRTGGLIVADNVLWEGAVGDPADQDPETENMRAFLRKLHADSRVAFSVAITGDGFALACKL